MTKAIYDPGYRKLVKELRQARRRAGLTQSAAGQRIGCSRQSVHKHETCEVRIDVAQLVRICRVYGLHAHHLVRRMEEETPEEGVSFYLVAPAR